MRLAAAAVALFSLYATTANYTSRQSYDTISAALSAWRLGTAGTLDLTNFVGWSNWIVPVGDQWVGNRFPGPVLWAAPFYRALGTGNPTPLPAAIAATVATTLSVVVVWILLRDLLGRGMAWAGASVIAFATSMWSTAADALWSHSPALLVISLGLLAASRNRLFLCGLAMGLTILCRPHLGVAAAVFAISLQHYQGGVRALRLVPGILVGGCGYIAYNFVVYGSLSILGGYDSSHTQVNNQKLSQFPINVAGALISPSRGLLVYTPVLIFMLWSCGKAWRTPIPDWVRAACFAGLGYAVVQLFLLRFSGGSRFYGNRVLLEPLLLCWPLLMCSARQTLISRGRWAGDLFAATTFLSVVSIGLGATSDLVPQSELRVWSQFLVWDGLRQASVLDILTATFVSSAVTALVWNAGRSEREGLEIAGEGASSPGSSAIVSTSSRVFVENLQRSQGSESSAISR